MVLLMPSWSRAAHNRVGRFESCHLALLLIFVLGDMDTLRSKVIGEQLNSSLASKPLE